MPIGAVLGSLVSAGAGLLGGTSQRKETRRAERIARADHQNLVLREKQSVRDAAQRARQAADRDYKFQEKWLKKNVEMQNAFAKEGLRWKVEDARAAGIHPLYALGANTHSFSPVSVGGVPYSGPGAGVGSGTPGSFVDTGMSNALANAGQDIGRAVQAMSSAPERLSAFERTYQALQIRNLGLEGEILASQLSKMRAGTGPGMPVTAFGGSVYPSPSFSDAEEYQRRYGEPAEWIAAPFIAGADVGHNWGSWSDNMRSWKRSLPADEFRYKWFQ